MLELYKIKEIPHGTFPLSFNIIYRYQWEEPFAMEKLNCEKYQRDYFCEGRNTRKIVMCKDKIVIPKQLQKYLVKWYHTYILHPGLDQTKVTDLQHLYWTGIR